LRFEQGHYGPYADNLRHVLNQFEGHFLEGFGDGRNSPRTPIKLLPDAMTESQRVSAEASTPEQVDRMARVFHLIEGFESPYGMELLASVHWVAVRSNYRALEPVVGGIHDWSDRKRALMKPDHIRLAWERLNSQNWLA
jgi:hypothetical protein